MGRHGRLKRKKETVGPNRSLYLFVRTLKRRKEIEDRDGLEAGKEYWEYMMDKLDKW